MTSSVPPGNPGDAPEFDEELVPQGVGPHPLPWPQDGRLDPALLAQGDHRNVLDRYRYWTVEAIRADQERTRRPFHVAVENWKRDPNIGAAVRNANAFGAAAFHVIGKKRWNSRGAMKTHLYMHLHHHETVEELLAFARTNALTVVAVDNVAGAQDIMTAQLPRACVLVFGQERDGISSALQAAASLTVAIPTVGSTRSINAGAASAVAMFAWCQQHTRG